MASEVGSNSLSRVKSARQSNAAMNSSNMVPIRVKCARCPNHMYKYVQVRQLWAFKPGDPRITRLGVDRQVTVENWCLSCMRSLGIDDDNVRTAISISTG